MNKRETIAAWCSENISPQKYYITMGKSGAKQGGVGWEITQYGAGTLTAYIEDPSMNMFFTLKFATLMNSH